MLNFSKKQEQTIIRAVKIAVIVLLCAVMLGLAAPIYLVIIRAFMPPQDLFPMKVFPSELFFGSFAELFSGAGENGIPFSRNFFTTLLVSVITTAIQIPITAGAAYVFTKTTAPGAKAMGKVMELALILTPVSIYVPQYIFMMHIGLSNRLFGMILPFIASPLAVFLMMKGMNGIPNEIVDCARLDGASHFRICFGIVMPNIKPAWISVLLITLGSLWTYSGELIAVRVELKPLGAMLPRFSADENTAGLFCALATVMCIPMIAAAILCRKPLSKAVEMSGVKNTER